MNETKEDKLINSMLADDESVNVLADYLGYQVGKNPIDPSSPIKIYFSDKLPDKSAGAMAVVPEPDLDVNTKVVDIRKLYSKVLDIRDNQLGLGMPVSVICFIGKHRLVFFPTLEGNRDTRLDLTPETINVDFYKKNMGYLHNDRVQVQKSPFGLNARVEISKNAFKKKLSDSFLQMINFYRKKLSEWITASDLKKILSPILLSDKDKKYIADNNINLLVQDESYKSALSTVVDTIILRQLMRRFLEGYYGADSFNVDDISLGVGSGTLDDAIQQSVNFAESIKNNEETIKRLNREKLAIGQTSLFELTPDEQEATATVEVKKEHKKYLSDLSKKALEQFKLAYGGDLFAGSIGKIATKIETKIDELNPGMWSKMYVDTVLGNYSFRYQDLPPEVIEKQYEDSMSQDVQLTLNRDTGKAEAFFGDDTVEQKSKGAYYTDQRFVSYMIDKTVGVEFNKRFKQIKEAIKGKDSTKIDQSIQHLLDLKIADFTCGGGSFLRGAFLKLADQFNLLQGLDYPEEIRTKYKFLQSDNDEAQYQWENYILHHMIYGVDIDYKAIIITSLTLSLSSLQHRPKHTKLPSLIGHTLINQNSLINAIPYYRRKEVFGKYKYEISKLYKLKETDFKQFEELRDNLQSKVIPECGKVSHYASFLKIQSIELNLPEVYFNEDGSVNEHGGMDIVVGNPPWEVWKPNSDEFFTQYDESFRNLPNKKTKRTLEKKLIAKIPEIGEKWENIQNRIKAGSMYFRSSDAFHYQTWRVNGRKTSSDLNLYKNSVERFTQLAKATALFSILVPDNFATDNGSTGIRHLVFDKYQMLEFLSFSNQKMIFKAVTSPFKFAVLTFSGTKDENLNTFKAFFYRDNLSALSDEEIKFPYPVSFVKEIEPERYALVEAQNQELFDIFKKIRTSFPALGKTNLIQWRRDFDRTNDADLFLNIHETDTSYIPLFEGKYVTQFKFEPNKLEYAIKRSVAQKKLGDDLNSYRIIIRAVSRAIDKRTLVGTLLCKEASSTNSLLSQKNAYLMSDKEKLFILGMLNSYVIDFVLRQLISANVNQIYLKQLPIPKEKDLLDSYKISEIVKSLLQENSGNYYDDLDISVPGTDYKGWSHKDLVAELNARVMLDFDLNRDEVLTLMKTFVSPKFKKEVEDEIQRILDFYDQLKEEGEK